MSTFSTYNTKLEKKLASASESFYDLEMKVHAINATISEIVKFYDIPEMIKVSTVTFDATGIATKPTDLFRLIDKPWDVDSTGIKTVEYEYIEPNVYDSLASTSAYYWTEDYVTTAKKWKVLPINSGILYIRYIKNPTEVDTSGTLDSGLSSLWDEPVIYGAAQYLFENATRWKEAEIYERKYYKCLASTYLLVKNPGGAKQRTRVKSRWEHESLLNRAS